MPESLALTTPVAKATTNWRIKTRTFEVGNSWDEDGELVVEPERSFVELLLVGQDEHREQVRWAGVDAHNMIVAINKANCSVKSMNTRLLEKAIADFPAKFGGVVQGAAD